MTRQDTLVPAETLAAGNTARFPNESAEYRAARNALLAEEIAVRRATERVAELRRQLPPGGEVPEDYRFTGEEGRYVVDEAIVTGHIHGDFAGMAGEGAPVEFRMLHVFEIRDGLISYENAWFDASAVQRQIARHREAQLTS